MITLYNVIDTRTDTFYSVAMVKEQNAKWFVPVVIGEPEPEVVEEPVEEVIEEPEPSEQPEVEEVSEEVETPAVSGLSDESQETPNEEGDSE